MKVRPQAVVGAAGLPAAVLAVVVAMYEVPVARTMPVGILRYSLVAAAAFTTIDGCVVPRVTEVASYILRYVTDELAVLSNSR